MTLSLYEVEKISDFFWFVPMSSLMILFSVIMFEPIGIVFEALLLLEGITPGVFCVDIVIFGLFVFLSILLKFYHLIKDNL